MQSRPLAALLRRSHARSGSVAGRKSRWMSTSSFYDSQSGRHITLDEWVRLYDLTAPATELASVDSADDLPASGGVLLTLAARGTEVEGRAEAVVIAQAAKARDMPVRALISNAFGCEEHGSTDPNVLQLVAAELADVGVDVITLGDQEVREGTTVAAAARLRSHSPATRVCAHPPPPLSCRSQGFGNEDALEEAVEAICWNDVVGVPLSHRLGLRAAPTEEGILLCGTAVGAPPPRAAAAPPRWQARPAPRRRRAPSSRSSTSTCARVASRRRRRARWRRCSRRTGSSTAWTAANCREGWRVWLSKGRGS